MANLDELSREIVTAEVVRFWSAFVEKAADALEAFYDPQAIVFPSAAKRSEAGRLTVARRRREYFSREARLRHSLGPIDVQTIGPQTAIASYTFRFEAKNVAGSRLGTVRDETIESGRATQVWISDRDGLRIVHEHFSEVMP